MTEATPRPWKLGPLDDRVYGPDGTDIALMWADNVPFKTDVANAALIVRCVNNYDEALALLREAEDYVNDAKHSDDYTLNGQADAKALFARIDAFLAKENSNG